MSFQGEKRRSAETPAHSGKRRHQQSVGGAPSSSRSNGTSLRNNGHAPGNNNTFYQAQTLPAGQTTETTQNSRDRHFNNSVAQRHPSSDSYSSSEDTPVGPMRGVFRYAKEICLDTGLSGEVDASVDLARDSWGHNSTGQDDLYRYQANNTSSSNAATGFVTHPGTLATDSDRSYPYGNTTQNFYHDDGRQQDAHAHVVDQHNHLSGFGLASNGQAHGGLDNVCREYDGSELNQVDINPEELDPDGVGVGSGSGSVYVRQECAVPGRFSGHATSGRRHAREHNCHRIGLENEDPLEVEEKRPDRLSETKRLIHHAEYTLNKNRR
ncbi:hypothetical protein F503_00244 [Ophiostoma piceae UAMH 11346]|uniref:Uncharacterized protein n=1 Tax=Ophiostoma piceae (strain UAMH 11346) TaxID=1262450 RepID=S3C3Z7_OPHP1|nr:hypothetical protein F503_00244 [Ophiostoma piceae UAMH 11346]